MVKKQSNKLKCYEKMIFGGISKQLLLKEVYEHASFNIWTCFLKCGRIIYS